MTTTTTTPLLDRVAELEGRDDHAETFHHADGSVTVVAYDQDPYDHDSPRDWDGNVATLIMESPEYGDLDNDTADLASARDRWEHLEYQGHYGRSNRQATVETWQNVGEAALIRSGMDREAVINRYVAMFRPDIAYYCDEWTVHGHSQSDWARGWGYVTTDSLTKAGLTADHMAAHDMTPVTLFAAELDVYRQHFAGEYYYATHLSPRPATILETVIDYATEPVDHTDEGYDEDACYGFLSYEHLADIAGHFTSSPVPL